MPAHEPVERFDAVWSDAVLVGRPEALVAQHREDRAVFLAALERCLRGAPVARVLEVGCGTAVDLGLLQRAVRARAVGLDLSAEALGIAGSLSSAMATRVLLCQGDVFSLPFRDGTFGVVFSQGVLEHFRDPSGAVSEQARVLAGGGTLVISVPQRWTGYTLHKRRAIARGTWPWGWEREFSGTELARLGSDHGLRCREIFGYQYWRNWAEPAWIIRDLYGKLHRRNPAAARPPFTQLNRLYDRLWGWLERRWGYLFLQNVVAVLEKPDRR